VVSFVDEVAFCKGEVVSLKEGPTIPPGAGVWCSEELKECGSLVLEGAPLDTTGGGGGVDWVVNKQKTLLFIHTQS
jgi:hypothetical protein